MSNTLALAGAMLFTVLYILAGNLSWRRLISHAETPEELDVVVGSAGVSPAMVFGRYVMVFTWPLWTIVPSIILAVISIFSPKQKVPSL